MFEQTSAVGVETILNRLPQFVPAVTQFTTGDVQQTATNTVGASTVSLRGLGPNRNLVLINGRRAMPVNPTMVVDTNSIPSARDPTRRGDLGRRFGRVRRGRRRRRRQLHPQGQLRRRHGRRPLRRYRARRRSDGDDLGALRRQRGRRPRQRHDRHRARHAVEADYAWERDWRVEDMANPNMAGGGFAFGSATWFHNEPTVATATEPELQPTSRLVRDQPARYRRPVRPEPDLQPGLADSAHESDGRSQQPASGCCRRALPAGTALVRSRSRLLSEPGDSDAGSRTTWPPRAIPDQQGRHRLHGFGRRRYPAPGAYRFNGPVYNHPTNPRSGDLDGSSRAYRFS